MRVHYFTPGTSNAVWSYAFNAASQLSSVARDNDAFAWTSHYAVQRPYTTNGLNQYSAAGGAAFLYDDNGNLTADPKRAFVYDIENRLVSATPLPGSDAVAAALVYDPLGRLFQVSSPATGTRRFLYGGDALVAEYDPGSGSGTGLQTIIRRHVHWPGADLPMVTYECADLATPRQLLADHQGSIVALADASGTAVQINRYDEYGIPGAGNDGTFQYTGQVWLPELGMYHYKARIYSPTLGRFLQVDPIGYDDQLNLYAYVANDPLNLVDTTGQTIILATHNVAGGISHAKTVMIPNNQALYRNHPLFQNHLPDGRRYATLGAGPEGGRLVSHPNRETDLNVRDNNFQREINPPRGMNENEAISRLIAADTAYTDDLDYDLYPNGFFGNGADGFNSNSYTRGLLDRVGMTGLPNFGSSVPGWNKPIPQTSFNRRAEAEAMTGTRIRQPAQ